MTEPKTKKCEVCGARKPVADFSKSYKNRCKACVAAEARMHRESARDEENRIKPRLKDGVHGKWTRPIVFKKARNIITGEVVEVTPDEASIKCQVPVFRTVDGRDIPQYALQFEPEIDWEQRTFEAALTALTGILSNPAITDCYEDGVMTCAAHDATIAARTLIAELQKGDVQ